MYKKKITDGDSDTITWSELFKEFTDLSDARQLAAFKLLPPAKLGLIVKIAQEAIPLSEIKALEAFRLRMSQDGINPERFIEYLTTGKVIGSEIKTNSDIREKPKTTETKKIKRINFSKDDIERRRNIIKSMILENRPTKEIVKAVMSAGLMGKETSTYPEINHIKKQMIESGELNDRSREPVISEQTKNDLVETMPSTGFKTPKLIDDELAEKLKSQLTNKTQYPSQDNENDPEILEAEREFSEKAHSYQVYS